MLVFMVICCFGSGKLKFGCVSVRMSIFQRMNVIVVDIEERMEMGKECQSAKERMNGISFKLDESQYHSGLSSALILPPGVNGTERLTTAINAMTPKTRSFPTTPLA